MWPSVELPEFVHSLRIAYHVLKIHRTFHLKTNLTFFLGRVDNPFLPMLPLMDGRPHNLVSCGIPFDGGAPVYIVM